MPAEQQVNAWTGLTYGPDFALSDDHVMTGQCFDQLGQHSVNVISVTACVYMQAGTKLSESRPKLLLKGTLIHTNM